MGMSASQARLLSITARLADTELQAQQVANAKIRLASDSDDVSRKYLEALQGTKTNANKTFDYVTKYATATLDILAADGLRVRNQDYIVASNADGASDAQKALWESLNNNNALLTDGLFNSASLILQRQVEVVTENGVVLKWQDVSTSATPDVVQETDDTAVAIAEAEYNQKMTAINSKEKILDMDLKKIESEHNALQTEYDSVKKVIDKNIERSFKIFS